MKLTCTKEYPDLPFAHRQPKHSGHCALIHGHNWAFEFTFAAKQLDECGFVIDFGKLKPLKAWLEERFDHTLVLNSDDPHLNHLRPALEPAFAKIVVVPDCSSEGLAAWLLEHVDAFMQEFTGGRVSVESVKVIEDSKNFATASR